MLKIELIPELDRCIETTAKKEYTALQTQLLALGKENPELEERLEVLRVLLETADFKKLRAESERKLMKGKQVRFVVYLEKGISRYEMYIA